MEVKLKYKCDACGETFSLLESTVMETNEPFPCSLCGANKDYVHYVGYSDSNNSQKEKDEYWYQCECVNCHKTFRTLQKDADNVIQCPFCKARPWGFMVSGTKKN